MRPEVMDGQWVVSVTPRCPLWVQALFPVGCSLPSSAQGGHRPQAPLGSFRFSPSLEFPWVPHKSLSLVGNSFSRSGGGEEGGPGFIPGSPWACEVL